MKKKFRTFTSHSEKKSVTVFVPLAGIEEELEHLVITNSVGAKPLRTTEGTIAVASRDADKVVDELLSHGWHHVQEH